MIFRFCLARLRESKILPSKADGYVYLECFLLHYRNLLCFFSGRNHYDEGQSYREIADELSRSVMDVHRVAMTLGCAAAG